jgi:hypothetical protein
MSFIHPTGSGYGVSDDGSRLTQLVSLGGAWKLRAVHRFGHGSSTQERVFTPEECGGSEGAKQKALEMQAAFLEGRRDRIY